MGHHELEAPPSQRIRVACVGDSLTRGSHGREPLEHAWKPTQCSLRSSSCQGSYPAILQVLLDARFYDVRDFGESGRSLHSLMPSVCPPGMHGLANGNVQWQSAMAVCKEALLKTKLVSDVASFSPRVLVLMLGTNDAQHYIVRDRLAEVAPNIQQKLSLLLHVMRRPAGEHSPPLTLILQPPPTMAEAPLWRPKGGCAAPGSAPHSYGIRLRPTSSTCDCAAMHTCYYNKAGCVHLFRCLTCGPSELIPTIGNTQGNESVLKCVRVDAIGHVRLGVSWAAAAAVAPGHASASMGADAMAHRNLTGTGCEGAVLPVPPLEIAPDWHMFLDPYHFRPAAAAAVACHVLSRLLHHCDGSATQYGRAEIVVRHLIFCEPVLRVARSPSTDGLRQLVSLEQKLVNLSSGNRTRA